MEKNLAYSACRQILIDQGVEPLLVDFSVSLIQKLEVADPLSLIRKFVSATSADELIPTSAVNDKESWISIAVAHEIWRGTLDAAEDAVKVYNSNFPSGTHADTLLKLFTRKRNRSVIRTLRELSADASTDVGFSELTLFSGDIGSVGHHRHSLGIYKLSDAQVIGSRAVIATREGYILNEQNSGGDPVDDIGFQFHESTPASAQQASAVSLVSPCTYCFYHWMLDSLPKVVLAEAAGFTGNYLVPKDVKFVEQSMRLIGVDSKRLVSYNSNSVKIASLWIPTFWRGDRFQLAPKLFWAFRAMLLDSVKDVKSKNLKKVYIARRNSERLRVIKNEREIDAILDTAGFTKVFMEDITLPEQIATARDADFLVGPHGSGLLHAMFMNKQSRVIEFLEPTYVNHLFFVFSQLLSHRHYSLVSATDGHYDLGKYIEVPILPLQQILEQEALSR